MSVDEDIARNASLKPITEIARSLGVDAGAVHAYGADKAKITPAFAASVAGKPDGKLVLVTAMTPTQKGEGKTTVAIGLADGLTRLGHKAVVCLREPSLGPSFGLKGGATGSGRAQVVPREAINLHFTGDFHAIASANNLLAALVDNHLFRDQTPRLDPRRITWRRTMDMNDRALRKITVGLGGVANGIPREDGFDIVPDSEVMAVLCLARDQADLDARLARMVVGYTRQREPVLAGDVGATGAMGALLRDAFAPNLVQTLENTPALVHGGPFANASHGCNSVIATRTALALSDYVVTEAGFGADLGAEKFFNIKCRQSGLEPSAVVIVATVGSLKSHAGVAREALETENVDAVKRGIPNLLRHMDIVQTFGLPFVVAINRYAHDGAEELAAIREAVEAADGVVATSDHWSQGGEGARALAEQVVGLAGSTTGSGFQLLYPDDMPLLEKMRTVASRIYGASDISVGDRVRAQARRLEQDGYGHLPICVAKTHLSLSADPRLIGAPAEFTIPVRELRLAAGGGFVLALTGNISTMPGLPKNPAALDIRVNAQGEVEGLR